MYLFKPFVNTNKDTLIICAPYNQFICSFCESYNECVEQEHYDAIWNNSTHSLMCLMKFDDDYVKLVFDKINDNTNITQILVAVSESSLVEHRKEIYELSKNIFNSNKYITQILFTNTNFYDLLKLKSAYKYLTFVDYIMQNEHPIKNNDVIFSCLFDNASYIDLTKSFAANKIIYKNL